MLNSNTSAEQQAARWLAQLNSDLVTEQQHQAFADWLAASTEHKQAWDTDTVNLFWQALDGVLVADLGLTATPHLKYR